VVIIFSIVSVLTGLFWQAISIPLFNFSRSKFSLLSSFFTTLTWIFSKDSKVLNLFSHFKHSRLLFVMPAKSLLSTTFVSSFEQYGHSIYSPVQPQQVVGFISRRHNSLYKLYSKSNCLFKHFSIFLFILDIFSKNFCPIFSVVMHFFKQKIKIFPIVL